MESYYLQQILQVLNNIYNLLFDTINTIESNSTNILISICFFGLLFVSFRFTHTRRNDI